MKRSDTSSRFPEITYQSFAFQRNVPKAESSHLLPANQIISFIFAQMIYNDEFDDNLKLLSKLIRILRITFRYTQLCGRCLVNMTPVVNMVIHCVFALLQAKYI